jgi:hypothetical protein
MIEQRKKNGGGMLVGDPLVIESSSLSTNFLSCVQQEGGTIIKLYLAFKLNKKCTQMQMQRLP